MFRKALQAVGKFLTSYQTPLDIQVNIGPVGVNLGVEKGSVKSPSVLVSISFDSYSHLFANVVLGFIGVYLNISRASKSD